ncbi:MAG: MBL fold metallo-hydrolase [Pseudomonadota bacterium]|nr:MBL fold metallo-hydrolase [Burkholderiales bacterium]MDQ3196220.1 MBL fold metallo-hydrolase [Pseudomonadota bacterium]
MIFRQLFEPASSTYTYLLGCERFGLAVLIDPVTETVERDLALVRDLGLRLAYTVETHIHADHLTSARMLKALVGSRIAAPKLDGMSCVDDAIEEGRPLQAGDIVLHPLWTPGHTPHHHAYLIERGATTRLFSGDALLIDGCGRTDFQNGDTEALYHSVREKMFSLSDETLVYPAHDYQGRRVSSIGQEKSRNPRLGNDTTLLDFKRIMADLKLPSPGKMHYFVPGNTRCGEYVPDVPEELQSACATTIQG